VSQSCGEPYPPVGFGQNAGVDLLVAADDRTGAFETAAALADAGAGRVPVVPWTRGQPAPYPQPAAVVDLACRHLSPADAADRAAQLPDTACQAHKTDSTLRGNWADELVARAATRPVLLVPALPALGRTCVGGVVYDHGRPVNEGAAGTDVRRRVLTARPAEALRTAGGIDVRELAARTDVAEWLAAPNGVAVADADDDDVIGGILDEWAARAGEVVLAGTSAVVGGAARVLGDSKRTEPVPPVEGPVLVVCGSVHPASRRQIEFAEQHEIPATYLADDISARLLEDEGALIFTSEIPVGDVTEPMAIAAAASLARGVSDLRARVQVGALVVIGGDTAAAVIGNRAVEVLGSVDVGTAWCSVDGFEMPVVTRSGGFGSDQALVDLLVRLRAS
jgi:4-hydroxythreonine-4-phosphate dehydrogenase